MIESKRLPEQELTARPSLLNGSNGQILEQDEAARKPARRVQSRESPESGLSP